MEYRTVFDLTVSGFKSWTFPASGLIFVGIGTLQVVFRSRLRNRKVFPFVFLGFAVLWTVMSSVLTYSEYHSLRSAIDSGNARVVQGTVTDFVPMPATGHSMERF